MIRFSARSITALAIALICGACGRDFDANELPEPRRRAGAGAAAVDEEKMPLERVSLMLAADSGNVELIGILRENATEIEWSSDGPVAMRFAARRGYAEVVSLLASYGVCGEAGFRCEKALSEARANGHDGIVTFLESVMSP